MVQNTSIEVKATKAFKAKKSEDAKAKTAAKGGSNQSSKALEEHLQSQTAKEDELELAAVDPMSRQLLEMRKINWFD